CPAPDGWKNTQSAWLNPQAMVYRLNFATALGQGRLPLLRQEAALPDPEDTAPKAMDAALGLEAAPEFGPDDRPPPLDAATLQATLGDPFAQNTRAALADARPALRAGLMLGSPEFMRH
ncbi:MAG: DUF1800 family protein, partial [Nevskia sp.]|nr:DUF1800 family protein [Nevskia sp.]